jgi:hypothetical protein
MIGTVLDAILMLLLVSAIAYGVRLDRRLKAVREGQAAFAGAIAELNSAAGRAESALKTLREAGQETDLLHDRIVKARALKQDLEGLLARESREVRAVVAAAPAPEPRPRMAPGADPASDLYGKLESLAVAPDVPGEAAERFAPVLQALAANHAAKQSLNRARRSLDEDLFAA